MCKQNQLQKHKKYLSALFWINRAASPPGPRAIKIPREASEQGSKESSGNSSRAASQLEATGPATPGRPEATGPSSWTPRRASERQPHPGGPCELIVNVAGRGFVVRWLGVCFSVDFIFHIHGKYRWVSSMDDSHRGYPWVIAMDGSHV